MKSEVCLRLFLFTGLVTSSVAVTAQVVVPANPNKFTKRSLSENGGSSAGVSGGTVAATKPVVVQYVAVTPVQPWVNLEGKTMEARLLAFSAPESGQTGPVEIIREGRVRFLVTGKKQPIDYPLDQLGETEQAKIKALAAVAAKGPPAPSPPVKAPTAKE
jgi:hypothetical protein